MTRKKNILFILLGIAITAGFILIGIFCFKNSYLRIYEGLTDLLNIPADVTASVINRSPLYNPDVGVSPTPGEIGTNVTTFWQLFISKENLVGWWHYSLLSIEKICKITILVLPFILCAVIGIKRMYISSNKKHNKDTVPLRVFKEFSRWTYQPTKRFICDFAAFLQEHNWLVVLWLFIWLMNFNLLTVLLEFIAYYLYFAVSYDFATIPTQLVKQWLDIRQFLKTMWWIVFPIMFVAWDRWRKRVGKDRLQHMELMDCGFINELPIVSMSCGSMGKKKTTLITDMALSQEVIFRREAFERMYKQDLKFPHFPWIAFEMELRKCMEYGTTYNLASIKQWVRKKRARFYKTFNPKQLYDYDYDRYDYYFADKLKVESIWDVMETYAQLYFIYVIESSLIVSNYAIRVDNELKDNGNFPLWYADFFRVDLPALGRHSHILDFDILRLGKKVIENNRNSGSFEFGVVVITEVGKERGNNLELKEIKRNTDEANQKNDLFNSELKMCRHAATVDNYPFIKIFTDEQRPESWGADARDLADILTIVSSGEQRLALPCYKLENKVCEWAFKRFRKLYYDMRYRRGDNTLLVHILKTITAKLFAYNMRIHNQYGYSELHIEKERGTMDGKTDLKTYYLMSKKIYSSRFSTDCFSDYFNDMALRTNVGLNDYREYATERASVEELKLQNSYFINALYAQAEGGERNVS